ncbi:MAG: 3-dehydroquinate synthase [Gemmatimonadales bacterium]
MSSPITVTHSTGQYQVHIRSGLLAEAPALVREVLGDRPTVAVTDAGIVSLLSSFGLGALAMSPLLVPPGERAKTREQWALLTDQLLERGLGRDGALIAIGGGSIGDLTGFVAATYLRGIPFVQVPTTLLAMVDAAVGGKVGVDTDRGKNLVGAFHPPVLVLADPRALTSLPERDYLGGMAEALKHGLIADAEYFEWIVAHATELRQRNLATLEHLIRRSVEIKAAVVAADERESGRRAVLNAGHTVAHALEQLSTYSISHGEAVALGLLAECQMAETIGVARSGLTASLRSALTALGLPVRAATALPLDQVITAMRTDKKNRSGETRFALAAELGRPHRAGEFWTTPIERKVVERGLLAILGEKT